MTCFTQVRGLTLLNIQLRNIKRLEVRKTPMCRHEKTFGCLYSYNYMCIWFHNVLNIFVLVCSLIVYFYLYNMFCKC